MVEGSPNVDLLAQQRGYQTFDITPNEWRATLKVMDQVQAPGGRISTLARYVVEPDRAGLHRP